ncbi:MFS transporter, partial [Sciscionella sediminilitoris]|uniref:MFS transporter n=1 Tax=Sciscionella sediminilitoris TaxID=1445613 RepID=UPI0005678561
LLSAILLGVGLYVRISLTETADFAAVRAGDATARFPLLEVLRRYRRNFVLAFGSRVVDAVAGNLYNAIGVAYIVNTVGLPRSTGLFATTAAMAVQIVYMPLIGRYSDRIGRKRLYLIGVAITGLFSFPFFLLLDTGSTVLIWLAMIVGLAIGSGTEFAVQSTLMTETFPPQVRYTAISLVYQLSAVVGGLTPVAATSLLLVSDGRPWLVAAALLLVAAISFACTAGLRRAGGTENRETRHRAVPEESA